MVSTSAGRDPATGAERGRLALEARIRRRFETVCEVRRFHEVVVQFTRVANPDEAAAQLESALASTPEAMGDWQPYWVETWDSSVVLADELAGRDLAGVRLLDLGCGLGLTGTVAAAKGACVTMVDAAAPALLFARLNSWPWRQRVCVRRLDWRRDRLAGQYFPLIVGADILYDRDDWPFQEAFWRAHLADGGAVLLGDPGRSTGLAFPDWLTPRGWNIARTEVRAGPVGRAIRLFEATLPPGSRQR
jgi:predicted nicotinamide N-methyase